MQLSKKTNKVFFCIFLAFFVACFQIGLMLRLIELVFFIIRVGRKVMNFSIKSLGMQLKIILSASLCWVGIKMGIFLWPTSISNGCMNLELIM